MPSKSGPRTVDIPVNVKELKSVIIAQFEPIWRSLNIVKPDETIEDISFSVADLSNTTVLPVTVKIPGEMEVYITEDHG